MAGCPESSKQDQQVSGWISVALDRFESDLLRYAGRILGDADRARDVVQDTFLQLCREKQNESGGGSGASGQNTLNGKLAPWLYTVCRNRSLDVKRKEKRMTTAVDEQLMEQSGDQDAPDRKAELVETTSKMLQLVGELPENQREVIRLKFQSGLTYRQIAEVTGLSATNVGFLIHTGIKSLRKQMKDH